MQKQYRLNNRRVFNYLYKRGSSLANRRLVLIYAPSKYAKRVGFVVSKKIGKAVVRNKARRRMREAFRSMLDCVADNYNYVLIARPEIANSDYRQIRSSMKKLLCQANLYREPRAAETATEKRAPIGETAHAAQKIERTQSTEPASNLDR